MVATAAQIGFVIEQYRTAVAKDDDVHTAYGDKARNTKDEPVETFFEDVADAAVIAAERLSLLSADRRRFRQDVNEALDFSGALDFSQATPAATVIDDERGANHAAAIVEATVRDGEGKTTLVTWG